MEKQAEVLKTNPGHLKACILYEVLQKKSVLDSYRSFCKIIGDGVMEYFDFEYWFYQFYNGNCDFDHDRSQDPKQKNLVELPAEILSMIFEEIEPMERVSLGTVSKAIKGICDITPTKLKHVIISLVNNRFSILLDTRTIQYSGGVDVPSKLKINSEPEREIKESYLTAGKQTARRALAIPNLQIDRLILFIRERNVELSLPDNLHAKSVVICDRESNVVYRILNHLLSGTLERIKLMSDDQPTNLGLLWGSRRFLEAKEVNILRFGVVTTMEELKRFSHLVRFHVTFDNITPEIAVEIRNMLSSFKVFKSCVIKSDNLNIAEICRTLGANATIGIDRCVTHRSRIERSKNFLEFKISTISIRVEKVS